MQASQSKFRLWIKVADGYKMRSFTKLNISSVKIPGMDALGAPIVASVLRVINTLQDNIIDALTPFLKDPFLDGANLSISVTPGVNHINHTLGRKLQGYAILSCNQVCVFDSLQDSNRTPELTLDLAVTYFKTDPAQVTTPPITLNIRVY